MIRKQNLFFSTMAEMLALKISANSKNTSYRTGSLGGNAFVGEPDIMWQSVVYIYETQQIWTRGEFFGPNSDTANFSTALSLGELAKGIDLTGKTAIEILEMMLDAEYAPVWSGATAGLSGDGLVFCVGNNFPNRSTFTPYGSAAKAIGKTTATGGSYRDYVDVEDNVLGKYGDSVDFGYPVYKRGEAFIYLLRKYEKGNTTVVTSKGNTTNKTAANATTKVENATENDNIDTDYKIKAKNVSSSIKIYFAYPVFIDGNIQELKYSKNEYQKTVPYMTSSGCIKFEFPASYTNIKLYYYDTVQNVWTEIEPSDNVIIQKSIGTNSVKVNYRCILYSEQSGERTYKVTFNI